MGHDTGAGLRRGMVERLCRHGHLSDARVGEAFLSVPREAFLPEHAARHGVEAVYRDEAIVTRRDPATGLPLSSSSQPAIMARMLEMLDVRPGHRVLEVGAGTGYNAALLSRLVGETGSVTTVELDREVAAGARDGLLATRSTARVVVGDGRLGLPDAAPLDRIMVTASTPSLPRPWFDQLVPGGLLVVPLRLSDVLFAVQAVAVLRKVAAGFDAVAVTAGGFMPLRGADNPQRGATVAAPDVFGAGERPLVEMWGPAVAGLDTAARQRLVVTALGFPRHRALDLGQATAWSLVAYVALALPAERLVDGARPAWSAIGGLGLGVVDAVDGSIAFLVAAGRRAHIEAHGGSGAEHSLLGVVGRWRSAGRPRVEQLALRVRYGPERPHAWRSLRRGDQWIALDWRPDRTR